MMLESSISSILSTLKASIQVLALTAMMLACAVCSASEASKHCQSTFSSAFKASSLLLCQSRRHQDMKRFSNSAACIHHQSFHNTLELSHYCKSTLLCSQQYFYFMSLRLSVEHFWLDQPIVWWSLRNAGYIYQTITEWDICAGWGLGTRLVWLFPWKTCLSKHF